MTDHSNTPPDGTAPPAPPGHPPPPYRTSDLPEGAEPPPKGVRVAAVVRWLLLLGMAALAAATMWKFWGPGARTGVTAHAIDRYYCAMHPQIRSPEPGECPICHMNLEPIPLDRRRAEGPAGAAGSDAGMAAMPMGDSGTMPDMATGDGGAPGDGALEGVVPVTIASERQQLVGIATVPVTRRDVGESLRVPGVAEAPESALAQVHVRVPGFLERLAVRETGVLVARGQILAWFYSPQIYQAEQELLTAHRWAGGRAGIDHGLPVGEPPAARAQSNDMEVAARRNLELLGLATTDVEEILRTGVPTRAVPIRAPAAGYVTRRTAVVGLYAQPETVLYELADLARIWVVASLYERDLSRVRRGTPARFVPADAPDAPLDALVELVEPEVAAATRTARVRLVLANPRLRLRPGQYGEVVFALPATSALVVPRDAVIDTGAQQYVFIDAGQGRFEPRRVRTGDLFGDQIQVLAGLRAGERVVARGNFMLDSESRLNASLAEAPAAPASPGGGGGSAATGPSCETDFDRQRYPDRYVQCRACERQHRGMGSMEADCKSAIGRPWR